MSEKRGIAWFKHRCAAKTPLRVLLKGRFSPLHCTVTEIDGQDVCLTHLRDPSIEVWVRAVGAQSKIRSVDVCEAM